MAHPPSNPFPSRKTKQNLLVSKSMKEHKTYHPAPFTRLTDLNFLPSSSQTFTILPSFSLQHSSNPSKRFLKLKSPNRIQEERPQLLSTMVPFSFPWTSSTETSNDFESITIQHFPSHFISQTTYLGRVQIILQKASRAASISDSKMYYSSRI